MHIDVVDVHGADGFCNGHERSCTLLSSLVTASTSATHRMLQCVRADVEREPKTSPQAWPQQLATPVRWVRQIFTPSVSGS